MADFERKTKKNKNRRRGGGGGSGQQRDRQNRNKKDKKRNAAINANLIRPEDIEVPEGVVVIDGSIMEGGGQVIRQSMALSAITKRPVHLINIRARRSSPGLRAQHMTGVDLVGQVCQATLTGSALHSVELDVAPGDLQGGEFLADIGTAGSICLLMQVSLPPLVFSPEPSSVDMRGGTNAKMAPQVDYADRVFRPTAARFGIDFDLEVVRRGFYPQGNGQAVMNVRPVTEPLQAIELTDRGVVTSINGIIYVAGKVGGEVGERMRVACEKKLKHELKNTDDAGAEVDIEVIVETRDSAWGTGCGIVLVAETSTGCLLGGSGLGERGVRAEDVGANAAAELAEAMQHGGCTDEHLTDQIIVFMALADGVSRVKTGPLSLHSTTAIHFATMMTGATFEVTEAEDRQHGQETFIIECQGVGYHPSQGPLVVAAAANDAADGDDA